MIKESTHAELCAPTSEERSQHYMWTSKHLQMSRMLSLNFRFKSQLSQFPATQRHDSHLLCKWRLTKGAEALVPWCSGCWHTWGSEFCYQPWTQEQRLNMNSKHPRHKNDHSVRLYVCELHIATHNAHIPQSMRNTYHAVCRLQNQLQKLKLLEKDKQEKKNVPEALWWQEKAGQSVLITVIVLNPTVAVSMETLSSPCPQFLGERAYIVTQSTCTPTYLFPLTIGC